MREGWGEDNGSVGVLSYSVRELAQDGCAVDRGRIQPDRCRKAATREHHRGAESCPPGSRAGAGHHQNPTLEIGSCLRQGESRM